MMTKQMLHFFIRTAAMLLIVTGGTAMIVQLASLALGSEVLISSWTSLAVFSAAVVLWVIPVQIIDWLKLIRVQRRIRRIMFPYAVSAVQLGFFAGYLATVSSSLTGITFSTLGLAVVITAIAAGARLLYAGIVKQVRHLKQPRVRITAEQS
ncbi:hypothetical protein [Alkalicoccus luteus]|uniref:Uncharacterized protein n=1 Tax=Alkalicoccus luteus TaxID=1237094 RepID=A0A969TXN2_9BACI|nr:hypothetical protein [Alkalicoccus luteus]NJP38379.1 hypothetical protein [Alkalicoccus luteus]